MTDTLPTNLIDDHGLVEALRAELLKRGTVADTAVRLDVNPTQLSRASIWKGRLRDVKLIERTMAYFGYRLERRWIVVKMEKDSE